MFLIAPIIFRVVSFIRVVHFIVVDVWIVASAMAAFINGFRFF